MASYLRLVERLETIDELETFFCHQSTDRLDKSDGVDRPDSHWGSRGQQAPAGAVKQATGQPIKLRRIVACDH